MLRVERSGGFAGRTLRWSLDVDALDDDGRAEVHDLLAQAPGWSAGQGADRFSYRVLADPPGAEPLDVRVGEPLPAPARRLVDLVRQRSSP